MKRLITATESIYAMAIVNPQLCKLAPVQIEVEQRDEGPIPHLHVYLDKTRNPKNCAYVRLDDPTYSTHHDSVPMNKQQKAAFIKIMQKPWDSQFVRSEVTGEIRVATGYEAAVKIWIDTFGGREHFKFDENGYPIMPDYTLL